MIRVASYAKQSSSGAPLIDPDGKVNVPNVELLSKFDDVTLEMSPFARNYYGAPDARVPLMLRQLNPSIRLWMYVLMGDFWQPPTFVPAPDDKSAFAEVFRAINSGNGWLYDTSGNLWFPNNRVNLADEATAWKLGQLYVQLVSLKLFDGVFLDCAHTSIAWTSKPDRPLDVARAGFLTLQEMDAARAKNVKMVVDMLNKAGGLDLQIGYNGTGDKPEGTDVDMREGLGTLIGPRDAIAWIREYGGHWLKAEAYTPEEAVRKLATLRGVAVFSGQAEPIISLGPDRGWPPLGR